MSDRPIQVNDLVRLIDDDGYMPPLSSIGTVLTPEDSCGDHDVYFPGYPCPAGPDTSWVAHKSWLKRIDPLSEPESTETREELTA